MTGLEMMKAAMERRTEAGLRCSWFIPAENRTFTAYAKDEAQKEEWLIAAALKGWEARQ